MSDSLAERLAERLELPLEQSDRLIRTLAKIIRTQASRDGQVRVPGMGTFEQTGKALTFEADPLFSEVLNPRYARLEHLSLVAEGAPELLDDAPPSPEAAGTSLGDGLLDTSIPASVSEDLPVKTEPRQQWPSEDEVPTEEPLDEVAPETDEPPAEDDPVVWPTPDAKLVNPESPEIGENTTAFVDDITHSSIQPIHETTFEDELAHPDVEDLASSLLAALPVDTTHKEDEGEYATHDDDASDQWLAEDVEEDTDEAMIPSQATASTDADADEEDFEDPDLSETAAYEALREENALFEEDTFLEEEEPSAWAPPGTRWAGEHQDQLVSIEETDVNEEVEEEQHVLPPAEEVQPKAERFAPPPLAAEQEALPPEPLLPRKNDLPPRPPSPRYQEKETVSQRSVWPWVMGALLFVVIAGGAYYYFNMRGPSLAVNEELPPVVTNPTEETTGEQLGTPAENGETADPETEAPASDADTPTAPEEEGEIAEPPPPVAEEGKINRTTGGYTLVVGSRGTRANADADAARVREALNDSSIPVDVLEGTANGTTRFRIGVGQVPTVDEAVALKQRLGNRITADAWVTSISSDS